jgi:hypothetical protein
MKYLLFDEESAEKHCVVHDYIDEMKNDCSDDGVFYPYDNFYFEVQDDFVIPVDKIQFCLYETMLNMKYKKKYLKDLK